MNYNEYKTKAFAKNPEVKAEYDALGPQYEIIRAEIQSRKAAGITQKDLAERMGTAQANISRFESGNYNPLPGLPPENGGELGKDVKNFTGVNISHPASVCEYAAGWLSFRWSSPSGTTPQSAGADSSPFRGAIFVALIVYVTAKRRLP